MRTLLRFFALIFFLCIFLTDCKKDPVLATLTTIPVSDISINSAKSGGHITNDGGAPVMERGICWSVNQEPSISDFYVQADGTGTGDFIGDLSELTEGTSYYVRAYAKNLAGTAYGNEETFTTIATTPASLTTRKVTDITFTSAKSGGDISGDGGAEVTAKGICWNTSENPTTANNFTSDGSGVAGFVSNITGLTEGTTYFVRAYATNNKGTSYGTQETFTTSAYNLASITTTEITEITFTTAKSGGEISSNGGAEITAKGICWNTSENPTIANNFTAAGTGNESFVSNLTGLTEGTRYYVRAYATNSKGTAYGNQVIFTATAMNIPTLTTKPVTDITFTTAKSGGDISLNGGAEITAKGVCWNTSENPVITNNHTVEGTGNDAFASTITGLTDGTVYYVRAYATNSKGTAYGNQVIFTTTAINIPSLTTKAVTDITFTTAKSGGDISLNGGAEITAKGVCWNTSENPVITNSHTVEGTGNDAFVSNITGLTDGTVYYVRAYATNSKGTAYGNQVSFTTDLIALPSLTTRTATDISFTSAKSGGDISNDGGSPVTDKGICWNTSENPTVAGNHISAGPGNEGFAGEITGLSEGTTYFVRAYAVNVKGTTYGNQISFKTALVSAAVVNTVDVSAVTSTSLVSGGNILNDGGGLITERGVCWSTTPQPLITNNKTSDGTGPGIFASNITGLSAGTIYYIRAFATNSYGTSYGNELSVITPMTDIEGNIYKTVVIGNQVWTSENLRTSRFKDNTEILYITDAATWASQVTVHTPAFSWYNNDIANKNSHGGLYNWYTVGTGKLCPDGWHVPSESEFQVLERYIGVPADSINQWGWRGAGKGTNLKSTSGWTGGNGDNKFGFNALPSGYRAWPNGEFRGLGIIDYFWTTTDDAANAKPDVVWYRRMDASESRIYKATTDRASGKSIRCIKD